jgi:hypothetical protein
MKPVLILLLVSLACTSCFRSKPAEPIKGNCKQNSPLYLSITCNGKTRTSVTSHTDRVRLTFMGLTTTGFQVLNEMYDNENSLPAITITGFVPASNATGLYGDSTNTNVTLYLGQDQYYSTYFRLNVSSLGSTKPGMGYDAIEYNDAAGSYTGTFKSASGKPDVEVTGEFCMDMPEEKEE